MGFVIMISEIFSTSFLFSVAIIIIAVGGLFAYFNYRLSENNHKMQAMMGLVSTMADEMQYFRSKIHSNPIVNDNNTDTTHVVPNFLGGSNKEEEELIEVSDSEIEEDSEAEDSDEEDSDEEVEDSDEEVEDEDEEEDSSVAEEEDEEETDKKIITIDLGTTNEMTFESEEIEHTNTNDLNLSNLEDLDVSLKSIAIDMDISNTGDSNISINKEKDDYKKMSLNELRKLVCEKGLVVDASKLKKNELLKMLGAE
jgi:hypothetical protein